MILKPWDKNGEDCFVILHFHIALGHDVMPA